MEQDLTATRSGFRNTAELRSGFTRRPPERLPQYFHYLDGVNIRIRLESWSAVWTLARFSANQPLRQHQFRAGRGDAFGCGGPAASHFCNHADGIDPAYYPARSIERSVWEYFSDKAERKGVGLSQLLTDVPKPDIKINEALK